MRVDAISQLLAQANVNPYGKYLIWDDTRGFVIGAMLERIGPVKSDQDIRLIALSSTPQLQSPMLVYFNFSEPTRNAMFSLAIGDIGKENLDELEYNSDGIVNEDRAVIHKQRFEQRRARRLLGHGLIKEKQFSSLVIVANTDRNLMDLLDRCSPCLAPSGRLVIYSSFREALAKIHLHLRNVGEFVDVALTESWLRPYQVEPGRTHPQMTTSSHGGFLVSCTKVINPDK